MDIVVNSSPLILLSKIGRLQLLNSLFKKVYVPIAVIQEVQGAGKQNIKFDQIKFHQLEIVNKLAVQGLLGKLHIGEAEVMIGAIEQGIQSVVLDDSAARGKAKQLGLDIVGTLGILLAASKKGILSNLEQEITNLRNAGMYLSDELITKIMLSHGK